MRLLAFLLGCLLLVMAAEGQAAPTLGERLDAIVESGIETKTYPGAVLVVGKPGRLLHARAYGHLTWDADSPRTTLGTIYDLASVSKLCGTTAAALLLLQDGTLKLDDPVSKYIPGFEQNGKESVTVRDLMTHVSGLKSYESRDRVEKLRRPEETPVQALKRAYAALPTSYAPRTSYTYSCINFQLVAMVVEAAAGRRMDDLLAERVWKPLGMGDTTYNPTADQWARTAPAHRTPDGKPVRAVHDPLANYHGATTACPGNAGLYSSALDLARWCETVLNGGEYSGVRVYTAEVLAQATTAQMPDGVKERRGLGFDIYESEPYIAEANRQPGREVVGHLGFTGTMVWIDKNTGTYFVFLANRTYPAEAGRTDQEPDMSPYRKAVSEAILAATAPAVPASATP